MSWRVATALAAAAVLAVGCGRETGTDRAVPAEGAREVAAHASPGVEWEASWTRGEERAKREGKPLLVEFYADWCVWCRTLETTTLRDGEVVAFLSDQVVPVKLNVDGNGQRLAREFGVDGLPTVVVLSPEGRELGRIAGYLPAEKFLKELRRLTQQS